MGKRDRRAVVGIEALGLNIGLADEPETTLPAVPGGRLLGRQLGPGRL